LGVGISGVPDSRMQVMLSFTTLLRDVSQPEVNQRGGDRQDEQWGGNQKREKTARLLPPFTSCAARSVRSRRRIVYSTCISAVSLRLAHVSEGVTERGGPAILGGLAFSSRTHSLCGCVCHDARGDWLFRTRWKRCIMTAQRSRNCCNYFRRNHIILKQYLAFRGGRNEKLLNALIRLHYSPAWSRGGTAGLNPALPGEVVRDPG